MVALAALCALFAVFVTPVFASDCNEPGDCAAAATTARNPLVPIAGAGIGAAAGAALTRRAPRRPSAPARAGPAAAPPPPCQAELDSLVTARALARALLPALQQLRDYHAYLDNLYEATRLRGYMSATIDLAFLRQTMMGAPLEGGVINKIVFAALKGILKEELKEVVGIVHADGQSFDIGAILSKSGSEAEKKALLETLKEALTRQSLNFARRALYIDGVSNALPPGLDPQGPVARAVERGLRTQWAERLASNATKFVEVAVSFYNMGSGISASTAMLAEIRHLMAQVRAQTTELENYLEDDAMQALDLALSGLRSCLQFHIDRFGPRWRERWVVQHGQASLDALLATGIERHLAAQAGA
jgi:hypothetical protein